MSTCSGGDTYGGGLRGENTVILSPPMNRVSPASTQVEMTCLSAWHVGGERQHNIGVKSVDSGARLTGFKAQPSHYLTFPCLNFTICKVGILMASAFCSCWEDSMS